MTPLAKSNATRAQRDLPPLMSREEYDRLTPNEQGYVSYWQAAWPGSPVPDHCPYLDGSENAEDWARGNARGALHAQDYGD